MVRTQIQLTEGQSRSLKRLSWEEGRPEAELIRQSIALYLANGGNLALNKRYKKTLALASKYHGD